jgi:hypothetical protein
MLVGVLTARVLAEATTNAMPSPSATATAKASVV